MEKQYKEFKNLVDKSSRILLITPPQPNLDHLTATFALERTLKANNKEVKIINNNLEQRQELSFLKQPEDKIFIDSLDGSRDFLLIFNTQHNKIINIKTEEKEDEVVIRVTPEKGTIDPRDFSLAPADFKYDLIIIIGAPQLESLGEIYQKNTDLFFEVPKININNDSDSEDYAQVNIVDLTSPSVGEMMTNLLEKLYPDSLDKENAQLLLTGIISATDSFQKATTTPQTLLTAAKLIKLGANQKEIVRKLYRTKPLSFLKLWGRAMARLNWDNSKKFVWTLLSTEDFLKSRAEEKHIPKILTELRKNYPRARIFGIFYSQKDDTYGQFHFKDQRLLEAVAEEYQVKPSNNSLKVIFKNKDLIKAEKDFQTTLNKNF